MNTLGQKIYSSKEKISSRGWKKEMDLSRECFGLYLVEIKSNEISVRKKIMVTH
jgi:hypothetical protein